MSLLCLNDSNRRHWKAAEFQSFKKFGTMHITDCNKVLGFLNCFRQGETDTCISSRFLVCYRLKSD